MINPDYSLVYSPNFSPKIPGVQELLYVRELTQCNHSLSQGYIHPILSDPFGSFRILSAQTLMPVACKMNMVLVKPLGCIFSSAGMDPLERKLIMWICPPINYLYNGPHTGHMHSFDTRILFWIYTFHMKLVIMLYHVKSNAKK